MILRLTSQIRLCSFQVAYSLSRSSCVSTDDNLYCLMNPTGTVFPFRRGPMLLLLLGLDAPPPSDFHISYPSSSPLSVTLAFSLLLFRTASAPSFSKHLVTITLIKCMQINNIFKICEVSRFSASLKC